MQDGFGMTASSTSPPPLTPSLESVEKAIEQLYHSQDPILQNAAQKWLFSVQREFVAWQFSSQLLASEVETCQFFGAHTLAVKLSRDWASIPSSQIPILKSQLLSTILGYAGRPTYILTKLCIALTAYLLHAEWDRDFLSEIVVFFQGQASTAESVDLKKGESVMIAMFEFLKVLPEEVARAELSPQRRSTISATLTNYFSKTLHLIQSTLTRSSALLRKRCFSTLQSWIQFGLPPNTLLPIASLSISTIQLPDLFDESIEVLTDLLAAPNVSSYEATICLNILNLFIPTTGYLSRKFDEAFEEEDETTIRVILKLLLSLGETFPAYLIKTVSSVETQNFLNIVLRATGFPGFFSLEQELSNLSLPFYTILAETLLCLNILPPKETKAAEEPDIVTDLLTGKPILLSSLQDPYIESAIQIPTSSLIPNHDASRIRQMFVEYFCMVTRALIEKSTYPEESIWISWAKDHKDQFRSFRREVGDVVIEFFAFANRPILQVLLSDLGNARPETMESCLNIARSLADSVSMDESEFLPSLFTMLLSLPPPSTPTRLKTTISHLIGAYAEWFKAHEAFLPTLMQYLVPCLSTPETSLSASEGFRTICDICRNELKPFVNELMKLYSGVGAAIGPEEKSRVVEGVSGVIEAVGFEEGNAYLFVILGDVCEGIISTLWQSEEISMNGALWGLKQLKVCCRGLTGNDGIVIIDSADVTLLPESAALIAHGFFDVSMQILKRYEATLNSQDELVDALSGFWIQSLRMSVPIWKPRLLDLVKLLLDIYRTYPLAKVLEVGGVIVVQFRESEKEIISVLLEGLLRLSLPRLANVGLMESTPDITYGFFEFLTKCIRYRTDAQLLTLPSDLLEAVFVQTLAIGFAVQERPSHKAVLSFFVEFISTDNGGSLTPLVQNTISRVGRDIVESLILGIGIQFPRTYLGGLGEALYRMVGKYPNEVRAWMLEFFERVGFPTLNVTLDQKKKFVQDLMLNQRKMKMFKDVVKDFAAKCRGLENMAI